MNNPNLLKNRYVAKGSALALTVLALAGCGGGKSSGREPDVITSCDVIAAYPELVVDPGGVIAAYTTSGQELETAYISQRPESVNETPDQLQRRYQIKVAARALIQFDTTGNLTPQSFLADTAGELFCTIPIDASKPDSGAKLALSQEAIMARSILTKVGFAPDLDGMIVQSNKK